MRRNRPFHRNQRVELRIEDLAFEGKGIARIATEEGRYVVFVPNSIPGQKVLVRMVKVKSKYAEAKLLEVLEHSPQEIEVPYQPIPGAPYITLPLEAQHEYKRQTSIELFRRIGRLAESEKLLDSFIPSPVNFHYRNKMEYSFSAVEYHRASDSLVDGFALGFKKRGQWLAVEKLERDSGLFDAALENNLPQIARFFTERGLTAWHPRERQGYCRFLTARRSFANNGLLINLTTTSIEGKKFDPAAFSSLMIDILGERLLGLVHTINDDPGDRPVSSAGDQQLLYGKSSIEERMGGLRFRISLESFFQTNPAAAEKLYQKALDYVFESKGGERPVVLDLFSGTGTITQLLALRSQDKEVIGVELVPEAVEDAIDNARLNGLDDLKFFAADVGRFLLDHPEYQDQIDTVVMDPPRAGIAPKTLRKVIRLNAPRMVYISCNPATQARDMHSLSEAGYRLRKYSLVDQFPHTAHIESVALFEKE